MSDEIGASRQPKPRFDPQLQPYPAAVSFIIAGAGAYYKMRVEPQNVDQRVAKLDSTLHQFTNVVVLTALQDKKLSGRPVC